ncbi:heterokaryon incompatibility protein-domain-containing protein [Lasiosphaeria ovina]|uniref:Heterokaryon incompatibility protein-domain-containing protein n=1 Tax=Lasiosphaeria ovina TaxID=92902 RepID=A0AAE0NM46_9PEZI|nr:heterokaryon incompatibility protein-domain-containing protein [Lasiosphaeria ovina]
MRLIDTKTLKLRQFLGKPPPYAILSHTWGRGEVSFHDFHDVSSRRRRKGFAKIQYACLQARKDALDYAWVDTCCIDKSSSAELSEAINSMFKWYRQSAVCYAYIEDLPPSLSDFVASGMPGSAFAASRWFRRGWTLQELLAPSSVRFFDSHWGEIGERGALSSTIEAATGIEKGVLNGAPFADISVGHRMSWASQRQTTRVEDVAYSLLGIFDVNMPLLYGEGHKAFIRLQEAIMKQSEDQSILAWQEDPEAAIESSTSGILATSPKAFANFRTAKHPPGHRIVPFQDYNAPKNPVALTNRGLRITSVYEDLDPLKPLESLALGLNCAEEDDLSRVTAIYLERVGGDRYVRARPSELTKCRSYGSQTTVYGLPTVPTPQGGEIRGLSSYANPAQTKDQASKDPGLYPTDRKLLQYAIFVKDKNISTSHGNYKIMAAVSPKAGEPSGLLEFRLLDPSKEDQPLVIPTIGTDRHRHPRFKGAVLLESRLCYVLLVLGTVWNPATLGYDCWFSAAALGVDDVRLTTDNTEGGLDHMAVMDKVNATKRPIGTADGDSTVVSIKDGSYSLSITVGLGKVQGLDMFCVDVREPSIFPDPRRKN